MSHLLNNIHQSNVSFAVSSINDNEQNGHECRQVHIAAACGYQEVLTTLLEMDVNPDLLDADSWTPAHVAVCWGQVRGVKSECVCVTVFVRQTKRVGHVFLVYLRLYQTISICFACSNPLNKQLSNDCFSLFFIRQEKFKRASRRAQNSTRNKSNKIEMLLDKGNRRSEYRS